MNNIPSVVIVGRQNVGKSTLFNRIIKTKKAIIDSTPGVTRDLVSADVTLKNIKIKLIDSGGISNDEDITNKLVQRKTQEAQESADLILFLVEANNPVPIEEEYLNNIRKMNKKILIVMNKSDTPEKDIYLNEYYKYGLGDPISISAAHNRNIDILIDMIVSEIKNCIQSYHTNEDENIDVKIAILGKPNVGKSSLLNKFLNKERSIVSEIPGTTRDIIDEKIIYNNKTFLILDTAGIRKKNKVVEDVEYYSVNRAFKAINLADVVLLVIDSQEEISEQDKKISSQIIKNGKGLIIVLNKWDLLQKNEKSLKEKMDMLLFKFPILNYVPIINISAKTGFGINKIFELSLKIKEELNKRIETADLNKFIQETLKKYSPSSKKGILKVYYGTQTKKAPIEFIFFINKKSLLSNNYKQYITNRLREKFGFSGIPISVLFKDKKD